MKGKCHITVASWGTIFHTKLVWYPKTSNDITYKLVKNEIIFLLLKFLIEQKQAIYIIENQRAYDILCWTLLSGQQPQLCFFYAVSEKV